MKLFDAIASRLRQRPEHSEAGRQATLARATQVLRDAGIAEEAQTGVRRFVLSPEHRFCAMTLANYESYVVDLEGGRHAHYPTAGVVAMTGHRLLLEPDAARFSLEPSGEEAFVVDLLADAIAWQPKGR